MSPPARRDAVAAAFAAVLLTGVIAANNVPAHGGDFSYYWRAASVLKSGNNPYAEGFLYPFPTILLLLALTVLPVKWGAVFFIALSVGAMVYGVVRVFGWGGLAILVSTSFWSNVWNLQWGPIVVAAALVPGLGFLAAGKATIGAAALTYRPNKWAIGGFAALVGLSLVVLPTWPFGFYRSLPLAPAPHAPPVWWPFGVVGLVGLLRFREPRGRILAACTLIPASAQLYDHLLVWLAVRDWRDSIVLSTCGWIGYIAFLATAPHDLTKDATSAQLTIAVSVYVPAAIMMLRSRRPACEDAADAELVPTPG